MAFLIIKAFQKYSWILLAIILIFGWFSPMLMLLTFVCMIGPIIFSFKYGRAWCGNFCPRSSFNNSVLGLINQEGNIPKAFRNPMFRLLMFIALMSVFITGLIQAEGSLIKIGYVLLRMMVLTTVIQICLGIFIQRNAWCTICPMGTAASFITFLMGQPNACIKILDGCNDCGSCSKNCPVQIEVPKAMKNKALQNPECMKCRKCIEKCPMRILYWDIN